MRVPILARVMVVGLLPGTHVAVAAFAPELELTHAWSVDGPGRFDASGLAIRDGKFFLVTDRHQDTIFELAFDDDVARAKPAVTYALPQPLPETGYLDNEGLALAPDGGFYVVSELGFAVYQVSPGGGRAMWVTPNLRAEGEKVGLFATKDAFLEGVAVLGEGRFLLAAERQPRGVIEVSGGNPIRVAAQSMDASQYPGVGARKLDFGDLCTWHGRMFALARNQHLIVELRRDPSGTWREGDAWSYAKTEGMAPHRFADMTFGIGEGLAITDEGIYVLLDNNAVAREDHPDDRRGWLFAFRNVIEGAAQTPSPGKF